MEFDNLFTRLCGNNYGCCACYYPEVASRHSLLGRHSLVPWYLAL